MGNVPISCCRSKSPCSRSGSCRSQEQVRDSSRVKSSINSGRKNKRGNNKSKHVQGRSGNIESTGNCEPTHNLQHISEREPDDSGTDPSSNPFNRPIFAERSSTNMKNKYNATVSINGAGQNPNTTSDIDRYNRGRAETPLMSSQDNGYNSTTSTNLTYFESFEKGLPQVLLGKLHGEQERLHESPLTISATASCNDTDQKDLISSSDASPFRLPTTTFLGHKYHHCDQKMRKSSSCSTIYVDQSTISQPDLEQTIKCVSLAIYYHIKNRNSDLSTEIFDETLHPFKVPIDDEPEESHEWLQRVDKTQIKESGDTSEEPSQGTIYMFLKTMFKSAQLTSEYAITTLVYLERLMTYGELDITPKTWRRMFLGAILLSSKVWEDQAVWNVDYALILEEISVDDINELESSFLELIQFNMNVPSSVYAKYYFHLRTLAVMNGLSDDRTLLTIDKSKALEAMSTSPGLDWKSSPIHRKPSTNLDRYTSLEKMRLNGKTRAVLM